MPSIIFGLSPRSSFPSLSPIETDTNHKEEPRRSTATLFSSLFFPWLVRTRKKKDCCSNPHCVHTDIYVLYIYFRCTTAAAATDKRRRRKKGRHSIAQLLSDSNRRNRNPTDRPNPRWKRREKGQGKRWWWWPSVGSRVGGGMLLVVLLVVRSSDLARVCASVFFPLSKDKNRRRRRRRKNPIHQPTSTMIKLPLTVDNFFFSCRIFTIMT